MAPPSQLDKANSIPRLFGFHAYLRVGVQFAPDSVCQILIEPKPAPGDRRVPADVLFRSLVVGLDCIFEGDIAGRQESMEPRIFDAESRIGGLQAVEDLLLLRTCTVLLGRIGKC